MDISTTNIVTCWLMHISYLGYFFKSPFWILSTSKWFIPKKHNELLHFDANVTEQWRSLLFNGLLLFWRMLLSLKVFKIFDKLTDYILTCCMLMVCKLMVLLLNWVLSSSSMRLMNSWCLIQSSFRELSLLWWSCHDLLIVSVTIDRSYIEGVNNIWCKWLTRE